MYFKQGEQISVSSDTLNKAIIAQLKKISSDGDFNEEIENNEQYPCIQHVSFGKYNVFDENKNLLTSKPIKKEEAEKILLKISVKRSMENSVNSDAENLDKKSNV